MASPRIGLLVGNPFRDLPSHVLTAMRLCQDGCTSLLIPSYRQHWEIWTLAPDFLLLENLRRGKRGLLRRSAEAGIQTAVLDTEGGVFTGLEAYFDKMLPDQPALDTLSGFYAWGPRVAGHLVSSGRLGRSCVSVTGTPRTDFFAPPWRDAALQLETASAAHRPPVVLINGNFNMANPWLRDLDRTVREYVDDGHDRDTVLRWMDVQRQAMQDLIGLSRRVAARLPHVTFIYRPHPFEKPETYEGRLDGLPNLHLVKQGTLPAWILRASALISRGSSTAIEASLAGIPALAPAWIRCHLDLSSVESVSLSCATEDELVERLQEAVEGCLGVPAAVRSILERIVSDWFCAADGRNYERVAAAILRSFRSGDRVSLDRCLRIVEGVDHRRGRWRRRLRSRVRHALGLPLHWCFRHWRDEPDLEFDESQCYFGPEEVRRIVGVLEPAARNLYGGAWRPIRVHSATEHGEYYFGYRHGRAIVLAGAPV